MKTNLHLTEIVTTLGIISILSAGVFGAFGAIVHYLYLVIKEVEEYKLSRLTAFIVMGCFVGIVVHELTFELLGKTYPGLILISGFLFLKILEFVDTSGIEIGLKKLGIKK